MKNSMRRILWLICILGAGICIGFAASYYMRIQKNKKIYEDIKETETVVRETLPPVSESKETETETKAPPEIPVNFNDLWNINPEIYAWIEIPGTEVNYPIAQSSSDNSYYLDHTIEGIAGYPGSIYTEAVNSKDFKDFNTVIYGHDMEDGSMFGGLYLFRDETYLKEHETLMIYTPNQRLTYRIFTALTYDDRHIIGSFDFSDIFQREEYLASIGNSDPEVRSDSRIITLSTCIGGQPNNRLLVEAVLVNEE